MYQLVRAPRYRPNSHLWAALAGLVAAGFVAATFSLPPKPIASWTQFLGLAFERVLAVSITAVVTTAALCPLFTRERSSDTDCLLVEVSLIVIWLPSLCLFVREGSPWTILVSAVFAATITRALQEYSGAGSQVEPLIISLHPDSLPLGLSRGPQLSAAAAVLAQAGAVALLAGFPAACAILVGAGLAIWTWSFGLYSVSGNGSHPSQARTAPTVVLAVLCTAVALLPLVRMKGGLGSSERHSWEIFARHHGAYNPAHTPVVEPAGSGRAPGSYGILLWPEHETYTELIAPTPEAEAGPHVFGSDSNPLVIPFHGVYWFFKAPDRQPPQNSRQAKASPDKVVIRSTDRRPLSIEAHDHLGNLIDLSCCSQIQIAIRNADRYPDTVSLELVLIDTSLRLRPSESLGRMLVKSTLPWSLYKERSVASETLNFRIPSRPALHQFDEVKIIFRLDASRADTAARVAIDHLVLVPRRF